MTKNTFTFQRKSEDSLILVFARVDGEPATLALDTGATPTVVDLTILLMAGYTLNDVIEVVPMETAKGTIDAYVFNISKLTCLGISLLNKEVCSYDFLANNVLTSIDGVLGLNFFQGCNINIDFVDNLITVQKNKKIVEHRLTANSCPTHATCQKSGYCVHANIYRQNPPQTSHSTPHTSKQKYYKKTPKSFGVLGMVVYICGGLGCLGIHK